MEHEDYIKAVNAFKMTRKHVKQAHDDAEIKHDNYGEFYMDGAQYEIMQQTEKLLSEIDSILTKLEMS